MLSEHASETDKSDRGISLYHFEIEVMSVTHQHSGKSPEV